LEFGGGARYTKGKRGKRFSFGIPGTGLFYIFRKKNNIVEKVM